MTELVSHDREVAAVSGCSAHLDGLDPAARARVLRYLVSRFGQDEPAPPTQCAEVSRDGERCQMHEGHATAHRADRPGNASHTWFTAS